MGLGLRSLFRRQGDWYSVGPRYGVKHGVAVGAILLVVCALIAWRFFLVTGAQPVPQHPAIRLPRGIAGIGPQGTPNPRDPVMSYQNQISVGRGLVEDMVQGRLKGSDLDAFQGLPEFGDCRKCLDECEQNALGKDPSALNLGDEECRRNCLAHCSDITRSLMNP